MLVLVQRLWYPADEPIAWDPQLNATLARRPSPRWREDAQNAGWMFRERKLCLGDECVSVLEWRGPSASANDIELAESIAGSVELQAAWTDPSSP